MKEQEIQPYGDKKFTFFESIMILNTTNEATQIATKYSFGNRISRKELDIWIGYFSQYRVTRSKEGEDVLDIQKDPIKEVAYKYPVARNIVNTADNMANSILKVSKYFKEEADKKAAEHFGSMEANPTDITRSKLIRVANMVNVHLRAEKPKKEKEQTIRDYLDRELPIRSNVNV